MPKIKTKSGAKKRLRALAKSRENMRLRATS